MTHYVAVDDQGVICGFYDSKVQQTLPDDLIAITDEQYQEFVTRHNDYVFDGEEFMQKPRDSMAALNRCKAVCADLIDREVGHARERLASLGNMIEVEYQLTYNDALEWDAAGRPVVGVPDSVACGAEASGRTATEEADLIIAKGAAFKASIRALRRERKLGKASLQELDDVSAIEQAAQAVIERVRTLSEGM